MVRAITVNELAQHTADFVRRVAEQGETYVLLRDDKAVAELRPATAGVRLKDLAELLRRLPRFPGDETEAFERDVAEARRSTERDQGANRWES